MFGMFQRWVGCGTNRVARRLGRNLLKQKIMSNIGRFDYALTMNWQVLRLLTGNL